MNRRKFTTQGGIIVERRETPIAVETALAPVIATIDECPGAIFSSGFDYPGRYSRWDLGFVNPALEFVSYGKQFRLQALTAQGAALLDIVFEPLRASSHLANVAHKGDRIEGNITSAEGFFPEEERSKQPSIFSAIRILQNTFRCNREEGAHFGLYGAFGYDLLFQFENIEQRFPRTGDTPDCHLFLPLALIVVDRKKELAHELEFVVTTPQGETTAFSDELLSPPPRHPPPDEGTVAERKIVSDHEPGEFAAKVRRVIEGTLRGDYFEVVLSQSFSIPTSARPTVLFERLARQNPSPYLFLLNFGSEQLVGSSPEIFLRVSGDRIETCPIAGTIARGCSPLEDAERVRELMSSEKDDSELTMCTDVDRNDLARVCAPGTVEVIGRRQLEFYSHVIHTVDHVQGRLDPRFDALDAFQSHMWACTVTGAPKPAAVQEIENLECSPRRYYGGAIGMLSFDGDLNTGITLRTLHLRDGLATVRAGATLLYGSDPDAEERETRTKAQSALASVLNEPPPRREVQQEILIADQLALRSPKRVLLVDYRDSFVHNLGAYLRELNAEVTTVRHDFPDEILDRLQLDLVLLSPGPFAPRDFNMHRLIERLVARGLPIFGVCLGHQGIGEAFGASLGKLPVPMHGKVSRIDHIGSSIFRGIEQHFSAGRYHSLYVREESLPDCLEVLAWSKESSPGTPGNRILMALRHRTLPIAGVQFHPESLMTLKGFIGHRLLSNVLHELARRSPSSSDVAGQSIT